MVWPFRFATAPGASTALQAPLGLTVKKPSFFWLWAGVVVSAFALALLLGLGQYVVVGALVIMALGPLLIVYPWAGLWTTIVGSLVFSGLIDLYMPKLRPLSYAVMLLATLLALYTGLRYYLKVGQRRGMIDKTGLPLALFLFGLCIVGAALVNWHGALTFIVGTKGYFQVWGMFVAIYYLVDDEIDARRVMRFLLLLGLIQLPFVFHQFFVLVPRRLSDLAAAHGIVAIDVVAGTFGGQMMGGGRSPSLALLLLTGLAIIGAAWKSGQMKFGRAFLWACALALPILMSEVKIVLVLIPIALFLLFQPEIRRHPVKASVIAGCVGFSMVLLFSIYLILPGAKSQQHKDLAAYFDESVAYNLGDKGYGGDLLNRKTVYPFWLAQHSDGDVVSILLGHGPGQTNDGSNVMKHTLASDRYQGYGIDATGISSLLWEVGVLGTLAALAVFYQAYRLAGTLCRRWEGTEHWPLLKAAEVSMPLFALSLLHNNYFVIDVSLQALVMLILGYLLVMARLERKPA
ncbi:MAG: hypothetical protein JO002_14425 [Burkholderiaceae bacterium]|nr:hypothetical protein [Burkholderiaceae bacterium]